MTHMRREVGISIWRVTQVDDSGRSSWAATEVPLVRDRGRFGVRVDRGGRVASDFAAVLGGRIASAALSVITVVIMTRLLAPGGYGRLAYVSVVATLIFAAGSGWTSVATVRYGREAFDATGAVNVVSWERLILTFPALGLGSALAMGLYGAGLMPRDLGWTLLALAVIYGFVLALSDHIVYVLQAIGQLKLSAWVTVARQVLLVAGLGTVAALVPQPSPELIVTVMIASWITSMTIAVKSTWKLALWPPKISREVRRRLLLFSLPLVAFTASQYVIAAVDPLIIGMYQSTATVGVYAAAYQGYSVLQNIGMATGTVLVPLFVSLPSLKRDRLVEVFAERTVAQVTFVAAVLLGLCVPFAPYGVALVFGDAFRGAADPFILLCIALALSLVCYLQAPVILLYEKTTAVGIVSAVAALVNLIGDVALVGVARIGIDGAAIATAGAMLVMVGGYSFVAARCTGRPLHAERIAVLTPLALSISFTVGVGGIEGFVAASTTCAAVGAWLVLSGRVVDARDSEYLLELPLPQRARRLVVRLTPVMARVVTSRVEQDLP